MKLYRNKYIIGLYTYDIYELPIAILNNAREFSEYTGASIYSACTILKRAYDNKLNYVIIDGKRVKIELVKY